MHEPLVSIIVPFYNPKKHFSELLESLSRQSYKNLQIILVDDGSDQKYNLMAKEFVGHSSERLLITQENNGVASARQEGLNAANGDLIIHADSDDFLPDNGIELLVKNQLTNNACMVIGAYILKYESAETYVGVDQDETFCGYLNGLLLGKYHGSLCNKLIKRDLYKDVFFESGLNYMEDKLLLSKILKKGPFKIGYVEEPVYFYRQHRNSTTLDISENSIKTSVIVVNKIADLYAGVVSDNIINKMIEYQRGFEIYQFAKKGINIFEKDDLRLMCNIYLPMRYRISVLLARLHLAFIVKYIYSIFNK